MSTQTTKSILFSRLNDTVDKPQQIQQLHLQDLLQYQYYFGKLIPHNFTTFNLKKNVRQK